MNEKISYIENRFWTKHSNQVTFNDIFLGEICFGIKTIVTQVLHH
jgi:hypothetical protein